MLNEKLEYNEYTAKIAEGMPQRLVYKNLKNHLSGIGRPLTVIARRFVYDGDLTEAGADRAAVAKAVLNAWCGFGSKKEPEGLTEQGRSEFARCRDWLPRYIDFIGSGKDTKGIQKELAGKEKSYNVGIFAGFGAINTKKGSQSNTERKNSFESNIADAYDRGPLKNQVMLCTDDIMQPKNFIIRYQKDTMWVQKKVGKPAAAHISKMIGAVMAGDRMDGRYSEVSSTDLLNWCSRTSLTHTDDAWAKIGEDADGNPVYDQVFSMLHFGQSTVKRKLTDAFIRRYHPYLMDADEFELRSSSGNFTVVQDGQEIRYRFAYEDRGCVEDLYMMEL